MNAPASPTQRRLPQNPTLVPGSLVAQRDLYQQVANSLPAGEVLVVLPSEDGPQRQALAAAVVYLQAGGHRVTILTADTFAPRAIQARLPLG